MRPAHRAENAVCTRRGVLCASQDGIMKSWKKRHRGRGWWTDASPILRGTEAVLEEPRHPPRAASRRIEARKHGSNGRCGTRGAWALGVVCVGGSGQSGASSGRWETGPGQRITLSPRVLPCYTSWTRGPNGHIIVSHGGRVGSVYMPQTPEGAEREVEGGRGTVVDQGV